MVINYRIFSKENLILNFKKNLIITSLLILLFIIGPVFLLHNYYYKDRIFPGINIGQIDLSGMKREEAVNFLSEKMSYPDKLQIIAKDKTIELSLKDIGFSYDINKSVDNAYKIYRSGNILNDLYKRALSSFIKKNILPEIKIDEKLLNEYFNVISSQTLIEPKQPFVELKDGIILVDKGTSGEQMNITSTKNQVIQKLMLLDYTPTELIFEKIDPTIDDAKANLLRNFAEKFVGKYFLMNFEYQSYNVKDSDIVSFLNPNSQFEEEKVLNYINKNVTEKVNREPQNAVFKFENQKVVEFLPAKDGVTIDESALIENIVRNLNNLAESQDKYFSLNIPVQTAKPQITNQEVNDLGIKELIGRGVSKFRGSIAPRVHNIGLAASTFNGTLVSPGDTFSFNKTLGDVSVFTGYKQAYVIRDGRTVLGDGGGVCQVSSTLFRAVLNAGLPIMERRAHSYRVSYYEQDSSPGLDATVFDPTTDLKFVNDTPGHLLIQTVFNPKESTLVFEIYGTNDGRASSITKSIVTSVVPPPEDLYVDDPTLPVGTVKQIDYKAWGAKVTFNYKVERNGEELINKTFVSNYHPWQAVYLKGTGPAN